MVEILLKADNSLAYVHDEDGFTPLHKAASMGFLSIIQKILELSPQSITIRDSHHGRTSLHVVKMDACPLEECLNSTRMKELVNEVDDDGNTPLHMALINSDQRTANKLLEVNGINWKLTNKQGYTPMDLCTSDNNILLKLKRLEATSRMQLEGKKMFFHKDVVNLDDILDHYTWEDISTFRWFEGDNIFHIAAREGNMKVIEIAIKSSSAHLLLLCEKNYRGETPLHIAAHHGHLEVLRYIVEQWPTQMHNQGNDGNPSTSVAIDMGDINQLANVELPWRLKSNDGDTPAHKSLKHRHPDVTLYLLRVDHELASLVNNANESLLYLSADTGCLDVVTHILLEDGGYVTSGRGAQNVLHAAARKGGVSSCKKLMTKLPDLLRMVDTGGKTPLHYASECNMHRDIKLLLKQEKSAAFVYDKEGFTPLLRAVELGNVDSVRCLLELCPHSADLRDLDNNRTFLHLLKLPDFPLHLLLNLKALGRLVNEVDNDGNTALHRAILDRDTDKALFLLEVKGINWRIQNKHNKSPRHLCTEAMRSGETEMQPVGIVLHNREVGECPNPVARRMISCVTMKLAVFYSNLFKSDDNANKVLVDNITVVTGLLFTVTAAAAFTIPGGYDQNTGDAMRMKEHAIKVFMVTDVLALLLCVVILFRYTSGVGKGPAKLRRLVIQSIILLQIALMSSVLAFISGSYAVASHFKSIITVPIILAVLIYFFTHLSTG